MNRLGFLKKKNSDKLRKRSIRACPEKREPERERDKLVKQTRREDDSLRKIDRELNKTSMRCRRADKLLRAVEREVDRTAKRSLRKNEEWREKERDLNRTAKKRLRENKEWRDKERDLDRAATRNLRKNEEWRENEKYLDRTAKKRLRENEEWREKERGLDRTAKKCLRENEEWREKERDLDRTAKKRLRENEEFREKERVFDRTAKKCLRVNEEWREKERDMDRTGRRKRRENNELRRLERQKEALRKKQLRLEELYQYREQLIRKTREEATNCNSSKLIHTFLISKTKGPDQVCCCCDNIYFEKSVKTFNIQQIKEMYTGPNFNKFLSDICNFPSNLICSTCLSYIKKGRVPKMAISNKLKFPEIPPALQALSPLEERMCAPYIPFMTILPLLPYAINPQLSLKGSVVNIPVEIDTMTNVLPRQFNNMSTIQIKLKRHVDHQSDYMAETIRPAVVCEALKYLLTTPLYEKLGITLDKSFFDAYEKNENIEIDFIIDQSDLSVSNFNNKEPKLINENQQSDDDEFRMEADDEVMVVDRNYQAAQQGDLATNKRGTTVMAPGQGKTPVSWHEVEFLDELCFPKIYGGFPIDELRNLTYAQRIKSECRRRDRRACVPRRVLFMAKQKLERSVISNVNVCLRKVNTTSKINAGLVTTDAFISDAMRFDDGFRVLQQVRSSPAFWESKKKTLLAMIRQIGFPTFFLTLSATEIKWPELIVILHKLAEGTQITLQEAMYMELNDKTKLIRNDPVTSVRYIDNIFHEIMKLLVDVNGPFGEHHVSDYFERREFQARGSVHTHNLLYCNNAPVYDKERPESVIECIHFIDKFITCKYDPTNPNMCFQRHKHTPTCSKGRKNKKSCRFNYPIPPMPSTTILEPLEKELITASIRSQWAAIKDKINIYFDTNIDVSFDTMLLELGISYNDYILAIRSSITRPRIFLKRSTLEVAINSYNETILNILGSNIDIQFVLDPYSCASYMLNYVTKVDAGLSKLLRQAATDVEEGNTTIRQRLRKVGNVFINSNVMGAQEAVYHVLGLPLTLCSRASTFISTFPLHSRTRMLKSKSILQSLDIDSEDIFLPNIFEKYAKRPSNIEDICLADYAARFDRSSKTEAAEINDDNEPIFTTRKKDKILKFRRYNLTQNPTDYYREQLLMFLPWRDELKEIENINHELKFKLNQFVIENNRKRYCTVGEEIIDGALENAFNEDLENNEVSDFQQHVMIESQEVNLFTGNKSDKPTKDKGKIVFTVPPKKHHDDLFETLLTLNQEQRQIVMHVLHSFKNDFTPLRIYISGSAGVGKSTVINAIFNLLSKYFDEKVGPKSDSIKILLAAPSGKAAFNIGGMTLHSAFSLPVTQYGGQMPELSNDIANTIRAQLSDLQLLIIDEISMVGGRLLQRVDSRLRQIMGRNESFGGISVILVGDLNQLPPVLDTSIYLPPNTCELSILTENVLWEEFRCFELKQIMRQKNDADFITALNNLAAGAMTPQDISLIKSREVREKDVPVDAIRLFSLNISVESYNESKINNHPGQLFTCYAKDHITGKITETRKSKIMETLMKKKTSETGGLPSQISFKIGIKYMITSNIDLADGLVNGACGSLVYISFSKTQEVETVWIDFDAEKVGRKARSLQPPDSINIPPTATPIKRISVPVTIAQKMDCQIVREQIPVVPAEAITIHKSQGQTYNLVCVDLRDKSAFSRKRALLYVALSRVTTLPNLFILGSFVPPKSSSGPENPLTIELNRLKSDKKLTLSYSHSIRSNESCTIIYQNTRSLIKHFEHIKADRWYNEGDIIIFSESRSIPSDELLLPGFEIFHRSDKEFKSRSARGIMCFARRNLAPVILHSAQYNKDRHHVDLIVIQCLQIIVITGYRSPSTPSTLFFSLFQQCLSYVDRNCKFVFIGDFNWDIFTDNSNFAATLESKYDLIRALPPGVSTTDFNTQIDVIFHRNIQTFVANTYETYFSDHKPIFINIPLSHQSVSSTTSSASNISEVTRRSYILQSSQYYRNPRGMENLPGNNNCYVNATLQSLFSLEDIITAINKSSASPSILVKQLASVLTDRSQPINTLKVREHLANITRLHYFALNEQQDAAEFLQVLLNETLTHLSLLQLFNFTLETVSFCSTCNYSGLPSTSNDIIFRGYFPKHSEGRVNFVHLFAPGDSDVTCPSCTSCCLKSATKMSSHSKYLIIQLVRFQNDGERMLKITDLVDGFHPDRIEIHGVTYTCTAVVSHHGRTVYSGHYTATVRRDDGSWVHCNDSTVNSTSFDSSLNDVYIVFLKML